MNCTQKSPSQRNGRSPRKNSLLPVLVIAGGLLLFAAAVFFLSQSGNGGPPDLAVDREMINLGSAAFGEPVEATFTIANQGDSPLKITSRPVVEVVEGC